MANAVSDAAPRYVDTPKGLFTASGHWFRTREADLEAFAGPVLEQRPLGALVDDANAVLTWPTTLAVWLLPLLALVMPWWAAGMVAVLTLAAAQVLTPSMLTVVQVRLARVLRIAWLQGVYYVFMLSILAQTGQWAAVALLLAGFVALRWGWIAQAVRPLTRPLFRRLYPLPQADQALRSVIVRYALKYRVSLPEIDAMERAILKKIV